MASVTLSLTRLSGPLKDRILRPTIWVYCKKYQSWKLLRKSSLTFWPLFLMHLLKCWHSPSWVFIFSSCAPSTFVIKIRTRLHFFVFQNFQIFASSSLLTSGPLFSTASMCQKDQTKSKLKSLSLHQLLLPDL